MMLDTLRSPQKNLGHNRSRTVETLLQPRNNVYHLIVSHQMNGVHKMKKVLLSLLVLGLSVAYAGTTYHVNLDRTTLVNGIQLKAGECKVEVHDNKITFKQGKVSAEATVKVENNADKFASTTIGYAGEGSGNELQ